MATTNTTIANLPTGIATPDCDSPLRPFFDKSWRPGDIELVK